MWIVLNLAALAINATLFIDSVKWNRLLDKYMNCSAILNTTTYPAKWALG